MVDGSGEREDFGALQQRIHPAESRIKLLAEQTPARYVAFDLLASGDESLLELPFAERRVQLERVGVDVTPLTHAPADAEPWLRTGEGVVAKDVTRRTGPASGSG